ncbi:MAG: DUF3040 domain-containing protein [Micrococcales bacterium]
MGLSENDKKVLEQLERDLLGADDSFARKMSAGKPKATNSAAKVIAGALVALIGMSLLVFAAIAHLVAFGVAGFLVALTGLLVASANPGSRIGTSTTKKPKPTKSSGSFFENRWEQRRDQN